MTQLVGILNLTPDSFSGDGLMSQEEALLRVDAMVADGASVVDIGAESTRPHAFPLSPQQEWERLKRVMEALMERKGKMKFSIDTRHAEVARQAVKAGFEWVNDVGGGADEAMRALARDTGCTLVIMHSLGLPADPTRTLDKACDPVEEILRWAEKRSKEMGQGGERLMLDPGIGFGKTAEQSFALIKGVGRLKSLGLPLLIGHSRKSFLSLFTRKAASQRDPETLVISDYLAAQGVDYLRVHDINSHAAMLRIRGAL